MDNKQNKPQKPNQENDRGKHIGTAIIISLALILLFTWVYNTISNSQYTQTTYSDFMEAKENNNLAEVEVVMQSEALLIGNRNLSPRKRAILEELLFRIEAVKAAENKKYVLMNVPTDKVQDVVDVLPGAKSPTIMPLATEGWSSIHTVVDEKSFWEIISRLKELGAQGILVMPIEKMIL